MADTNPVGIGTASFGQGKALSTDLRGTSPERIGEITARLQHIKENSKDWVVPGGCLTALVLNGELRIRMDHPNGDKGMFKLMNTAHGQIADKLGIPYRYYQRMLAEAPNLLVGNINYWLVNAEYTFMLRTLDNNIRAILSQRYRVLDSFDFMLHTFEVGKESGAVAQRLDLTDDRFFLRLMAPDYGQKITGRGADLSAGPSMFSSGYKKDNGRWQGPDDDDPDGDWCFPVVTCSNSDTGKGRMTVEMGALRTTCSNLIIVGGVFHRVHLGEELEEGLVKLASDTRAAKDAALWLEVRDVVKSAFNPDEFKAMLAKFNGAATQELAAPIEAVEAVVKAYNMSEAQQTAILNELLSPSTSVKPGATVWGLSNAVSALQHTDDMAVDDEYEFARIGGEIIEKGKELFAIK